MKIKTNIFYYFIIITISNHTLWNEQHTIENEIKRHFNNMINAVNDLPTNITDESNFPQTTSLVPSKIEIDSTDNNVFTITLNINEIITTENINTEKGNHYIKIYINFNHTYYQIILKENELSIISESNQKIKNGNNTKYAQSSSQISRREKLHKNIDLNSLKIKVDTTEKTIKITAKYIDIKKNKDIEIEFK